MKNLHKAVLISGITLGMFCGAAAAQAEVAQVPMAVAKVQVEAPKAPAEVANVQIEAPKVPAQVVKVQTEAPKVKVKVVKAKARRHAKKADKVLVVSEANDHHFRYDHHPRHDYHGHRHCHHRRFHHVEHFYPVPVVRHVVYHPIHLHHRHDVVRLPIWISINI